MYGLEQLLANPNLVSLSIKTLAMRKQRCHISRFTGRSIDEHDKLQVSEVFA